MASAHDEERMTTIWEPVSWVAIKESKKCVFFFQFFHKLDMQKVINGGPWNFDGQLLILSKTGAGDIPSQVPLFHATFWLQIHDLPFGFMNLDVGQGLGNYIGEFVEYDAKNNSNFWRSYMRIRVRRDVRKPLKRGKKVRLDDGEVKTVRFKYERLTVFYFLCGLLGHPDSSCEKLFLMEEDDGVRGWGPELRVERRRSGDLSACKWLRQEGVGGACREIRG